MADVIVIGGGLAGLASAAALAGAGHHVRLFESRPFLGGRATSYEAGAETIDNCQHILLGCCANLLDFYKRLGVENRIAFHREYILIEPGGRRSTLKRGLLPAPLHFGGSMLGLKFLSLSEKFAVMRAMRAMQRERGRKDLESISTADWLKEQRQPARVVERFWRQILVSAISEELDRIAASHAFQVFLLGFMGAADAFDMGVPAVPLGELYGAEVWKKIGDTEIRLRTPVERVAIENGAVRGVVAGGVEQRADFYICAVPFDRVAALGIDLDVSGLEYSPITGIHLWFDRRVIDVAQATMFDRTVQWVFDKSGGKYVQVVVSASRSLTEMARADVIALVVKELAEFFPAVAEAKLEKAHVVKEVRAVFSPLPGIEQKRPATDALTASARNLFLAGDWTRNGWPATMEAAVRSGYLAAEAVCAAAGEPRRFLLPDPA